MSGYVIDSWAWMEYIQGSEQGKKVKEFIEDGHPVFSATITIAEVSSKLRRKGSDSTIGRDAILANSRPVAMDADLAYEAGQIHAEMRKNNANFGMADAVILSTARRLKARVLTGDPDFKGVKEAIFI